MHNRRKEKAYLFGMIFFACVLCCTFAYIGICYGQRAEAEQQYEELKFYTAPEAVNIQARSNPEETVEEENFPWRKENTVDFEALRKVNEDIYAWIQIPGTQVDYPVLQHPSDDSYYLDHTVDHGSGLPGSIYSELVHPKDFSASNTVLYGHNMKNDTMFGSLHEYENQDFFDENPYVYIFCPDRTLVYRIFAAAKFSDAYLPEYCNYGQEEEFEAYIEEIRERAYCQDEDLEVAFGNRILTLSTCIANEAESRFLLEAVLADEYGNE